jgi:hypothetical protein
MECYRGEISYCLHPKILVILENLKQISVELKLPYYPYLLDIFYIKIGRQSVTWVNSLVICACSYN